MIINYSHHELYTKHTSSRVIHKLINTMGMFRNRVITMGVFINNKKKTPCAYTCKVSKHNLVNTMDM